MRAATTLTLPDICNKLVDIHRGTCYTLQVGRVVSSTYGSLNAEHLRQSAECPYAHFVGKSPALKDFALVLKCASDTDMRFEVQRVEPYNSDARLLATNAPPPSAFLLMDKYIVTKRGKLINTAARQRMPVKRSECKT